MKIILLLVYFILSFNVMASELDFYKAKLHSGKALYFSESQSNGDLSYISFLIEYGHSDSILFAPHLLKYADSSITTGLYNSLARGLLKNPEAVLSLTQKGISIKNICNVPFYDAPAEVENIHINKAIELLQILKFKSDFLEKNKNKCLNEFLAIKR